MAGQKYHDDAALAALAKQFRTAAGKSRAAAARELGVARPTIVQAEENPTSSLSKLRARIIERYSDFKVIGPVYLVAKSTAGTEG